MVLIETYWNVKLDEKGYPIPERSINRNILECKGLFQKHRKHRRQVLIETYWNVKIEEEKRRRNLPRRINRNILECKEYRTFIR